MGAKSGSPSAITNVIQKIRLRVTIVLTIRFHWGLKYPKNIELIIVLFLVVLI